MIGNTLLLVLLTLILFLVRRKQRIYKNEKFIGLSVCTLNAIRPSDRHICRRNIVTI